MILIKKDLDIPAKTKGLIEWYSDLVLLFETTAAANSMSYSTALHLLNVVSQLISKVVIPFQIRIVSFWEST